MTPAPDMALNNGSDTNPQHLGPDPAPFDLNMHTARLLMREPFFAALSRQIDKRASTSIPTAGVRVNPDTGWFELLYNPDFMASLKDEWKLGVLMHEFYHCIFEHVTGRKPATGLTRIHNIAMDLAINGLSEMSGKLPNANDPGPIMSGGEPMQAVVPGVGPFAHLPANMSYEWYLEALFKMQEEQEEQEGDGSPGKGTGQPGEPGEGDTFAGADSFDSHEGFGQVEGAIEEISKQRLLETLKKAAAEANASRNWGSVSAAMRADIMASISSKVCWRKVCRYFVKTSQRAERRSTPRRLNRRFPRVHPGKRVTRRAKIAISVDQSGSVDDRMLECFFAELNKLAAIAEFTVIPFDTRVAEDKVYVWKKGQAHRAERVLTGGTDFDAPTKYVNKRDFDGHICLTDLCAPKPIGSKCQRMWMTTKQHAERPYFKTNERVIVIDG